MDQQLIKMHKDLVFLKWYTGVLTLLLVVTIFIGFTNNGKTHFKEISAERINILENNGQLRMVISNKSLSEVLAYGKPLIPAIHGGHRPGLIFFNDEDTENGGLVFMGGKDSSGKYFATGHFSFDQYNQNQVLYLTYSDNNGEQNTGLHIDDSQTPQPYWEWRAEYKKAQLLQDGPEKEALLKKMMESTIGQKAIAKRVFVGKDENKTAMLTLADRMGSLRLQLLVDSNGIEKLIFLIVQEKL